MPATLPVRIKLTQSEQLLYDQIEFSFEPGPSRASASGNASRELMESLLSREVIPSARRSYFTHPFPGGQGKSHLEIFQSNLRGRGHVFEDPYFIRRYLRYFIYGPNLPVRTMEQFCELVDENDLDRLCSFVRTETRNADRSNRRYFPEEFYKLALECIPDDPRIARRIRDTAMQARRR